MVNLTCTSSISSEVTFSWTHNGGGVTGQPISIGNTSILTITRVKRDNTGSYVCIVSHESLSVMSNTATLTVYGMYQNYIANQSEKAGKYVCTTYFNNFGISHESQ